MKHYKYLLCICILLICMTACVAKDSIDNNINQAKENVTDKVGIYIEKKVDQGIDSVVTSIESSLDTKLGEIRKNMDNVKELALMYYKINNKMPSQQIIESFFEKSFANMKIQYKISNDGQRSFITYIGNEYSKDKVPDIVVDPKAK